MQNPENLTTKRQRRQAKLSIEKAIRQLRSALPMIDGESNNATKGRLHEARDTVDRALAHLNVPTSAHASFVAKGGS